MNSGDRTPDKAEGQARRSTYDLLKEFVLPAIPAVGMLLSLNSSGQFITFFVVALLFGALGLWPRLSHSFRISRLRTQNEQFARQEFSNLRLLVRRFGDFVDTRTGDTLHYIIARDEMESLRAALLQQKASLSIELWCGFWQYLDTRLQRQQLSFDELGPAIQEFNNLLGKYHGYCVAPLFDRLPADARRLLSEQDKSKLNGFHGRYAHFVSDYSQFLRRVAGHPALNGLPNHLPISNPL